MTMASRTSAGTETQKFDRVTDEEVIRQLDGLGERIREEINPLEKRVDDLNGISDGVRAQISALVEDMTETMVVTTSLLLIMQRVMRSRLFRFLNFFGKWVIYAPDGSVYPNAPLYQNIVSEMTGTTKGDGSSDDNSKTT